MFDYAMNGSGKLLRACAVALVCGSVAGTAAAKGKPQTIDPLQADITGGLEAASGPVESHGVSTGKHKGSPILEVVVRNFDLFFNFGFEKMEGGEACFWDSDPGAAGKFILYSDGFAELQTYPEYFTNDGEELQQYELILGGTHDYTGDLADFPASGPVSVTADFDSVQVSTEGRGKRRDACTGSFDSGHGFAATATFDR